MEVGGSWLRMSWSGLKQSGHRWDWATSKCEWVEVDGSGWEHRLI